MSITAILDDNDLKEALAEIERLWNAPKGSPEAERLDLLATLVERYEDENGRHRHHPTSDPEPSGLPRRPSASSQ